MGGRTCTERSESNHVDATEIRSCRTLDVGGSAVRWAGWNRRRGSEKVEVVKVVEVVEVIKAVSVRRTRRERSTGPSCRLGFRPSGVTRFLPGSGSSSDGGCDARSCPTRSGSDRSARCCADRGRDPDRGPCPWRDCSSRWFSRCSSRWVCYRQRTACCCAVGSNTCRQGDAATAWGRSDGAVAADSASAVCRAPQSRVIYGRGDDPAGSGDDAVESRSGAVRCGNHSQHDCHHRCQPRWLGPAGGR